MNSLLNFFHNLPADQKKITLSTKMTILRIILVPFIVFLMVNKNFNLAFLLIIISALTDLFDGIIARARNECTLLGACLDPIADKLFIISCYFIISLGYFPTQTIPFWFACVILIKEVLLVCGAMIYLSNNINNKIKPSLLGKISMDIQTLFILWIFLSYFFNLNFGIIDNILLIVISILILSSFFQYAKLYKLSSNY